MQEHDASHALSLLRMRPPRPRDRRSAERDQQFPPSDGDCHTPLPREVRRRNDTTPRAYSLAVQGGAGCWLLPPLSSASGSETVSSERVNVFRFAPGNGHRATRLACPLCADCVAKVQNCLVINFTPQD